MNRFNKLQFALIFVFFSFQVFGQRAHDRVADILQNSNDIILRQQVVDSIINELFWDNKVYEISGYVNKFRKEDFSEIAKQKLLNYFNRSLDKKRKEEIEQECRMQMKINEDYYKTKAIKLNISFEEYYEKELHKIVEQSVPIVQNRARRNVSIYYPRLLGWLNYSPAIPIIESILKDSMQDENYAGNNREKFELNCKLALARMGNKDYETNILDNYKNIDMDCTGHIFFEHLNNLFYINTKNSINQAILFSKSKKKYERADPDAYLGIPPSMCVVKSVVLLYLSIIIDNYPLKFQNEADKLLFYIFPELLKTYNNNTFYKSQEEKLEKWLKENAEIYKINTEKFY